VFRFHFNLSVIIMHLKLLAPLILFFVINSGCSQHSIKMSNQLEYQSSKTTHKVIAVKLKKPADLWSRLRKGLTLQEHYGHQELDDKKHWDQDHQKYINKITENGKPYIYHIINKLENKNIPLELALLPAIESTYNPLSYSSQHASGLWQFIPATARKQGLKQDIWYDARRDPIKSTDAAIEYLLYLYNRFDNDWLLALAAYNGGEGTVRRAIKRNKKNGMPADFWSLKLPKETTSYVPRLLILSRIIASPKNYNINLPILSNKPYFEVVFLTTQIDISKAAEIAGISIDAMVMLNPGYKLGVTHPERPKTLLLPVGYKDNFLKSLEQIPQKEWSPIKRYIVKQGDTLSEIAAQHGISTKALMRINDINRDVIQIQQKLKIPGTGIDKAQGAPETLYAVKDGDSLWKISRENHVSIKNIVDWNGLKLNSPLKIGKKIILRKK